MARLANKRDFYRTEISRTEQFIGFAILLLLAAIGAGILIKGRSYDPAKYTGSVEALESTRQAVEGKAATLRNEIDLRAYEQTGRLAEPAGSGAALSAILNGLVPMGPVEVYDEETLYEKINGRAPAYFEYKFVELTSRSFSLANQSGEFVDVYLFRMDTPLNAYGIFSAERDLSGTAVEFAEDGYRSGMGYFLRVGPTYAQVLASSTDAAVMQVAGEYARTLVRTLPADESGLEGRALLPGEYQLAGTLTYIAENAYGQEVLSGIFEARYQATGQELTLFAQSCADAAAARSNWDSLRDFYGKYGTLEEPLEERGATVFIADMFGQWNVIYVRDTALVGVVNANDRETALNFLRSQL